MVLEGHNSLARSLGALASQLHNLAHFPFSARSFSYPGLLLRAIYLQNLMAHVFAMYCVGVAQHKCCRQRFGYKIEIDAASDAVTLRQKKGHS